MSIYSKSKKSVPKSRFVPTIEILEDRLAPAVVTSLLDDNVGNTLRNVIANAANNEVITFNIPNLPRNSAPTIALGSQITSSVNNLTIDGRGVPGLTITTEGTGRAFDFSSTAGVLETIENVSFLKCSAGNAANGGAIYVRGGLTISSVFFAFNTAGNGGAIFVNPVDLSQGLTITSCSFMSNTALFGGGAVRFLPADDSIASGAAISIRVSNFVNNRAGGSGGAIFAFDPGGSMAIFSSRFLSNVSAVSGGAIRVNSSVFTATGIYLPNTFSDNEANTNGGAISWTPDDGPSDFAVDYSDFSDNWSSRGGAVYIATSTTGSSTVTEEISNCLFDKDLAIGQGRAPFGAFPRDGGGLFVDNSTADTSTAALTLTNVTFNHDLALDNGGAIAVSNTNTGTGSNKVSLTSLTICQNGALGQGGGIYADTPAGGDRFQIRNTIVAQNIALRASDVFGSVISQGYNFVGRQDASNANDWGATDQKGVNNSIDPGLDPLGLQFNGGLTKTIAVPNTSQVYQAGDSALAIIGDLTDIRRLDQRRSPRDAIVGGNRKVTIGAFDPGARGNPPNNPPAGANSSVTTPEDTAYAFTLSNFNFTDPNDTPANSLLDVRITSLPVNGALFDDGSLVVANQFISAADIAAGGLQFYPAPGANGSSYGSFQFRVQDNGGTANGGVDTDPTARTMTINVTSVNDAPVGTSNTVTTLKNTAYALTATDFGFTDPNDATPNSLSAVEITTLPSAGSLKNNGVAVTAGAFVSVSDINAGHLVFTPATNVKGVSYTSFTAQVQDNGGTSNGGVNLDATPRTITINVMDTTWVNHAPVGANHTATTLENTPYALATSDFGFTDPNDTSANNFLAVKITALPTHGTLTDNGVTVAVNSFVSVSHITAGLLIYSPNTNAGGTGFDIFTFKVEDDGGTNNSGVNLDTTARTMTINVTVVNQAPIGADNTVATLENTAKVFAAADFGFSDPNEASPNSLAAVEITSLPMFGTLTDNGSAVTAGSFISVSDINAGHLVFTPETNMSGSGYDAFFFQMKDNGGTTGGGIDTDPTPRMMTINVTWVNQAPVGTSSTVGTLENTAYVVQASDFGFTDPNDSFSNWFQAVKIVTLPSAGTLKDNGTAVTVNQFVSLNDILAGLLVYTPATNAYGTTVNFTFKVQDDGGTANGGVDTDPSAKTLTINVYLPAAVSSAIVNAGTPAYTDSNGLSVSLAGQNSIVEQILVTFNEAVTLDPGAFTITNNAAGVTVYSGPAANTAAVTANFAVVPGSGNTQYIVTFSGAGTLAIPGGTGAVIKNGLYILNTIGPKVHSNGLTAPADTHTGFWALFGSAVSSDNVVSSNVGDGNSEVFVDNFDYSLFVSVFGSDSDNPSGPPAYNPALDYNLSGYVDNFDYSAFETNFGADWVF